MGGTPPFTETTVLTVRCFLKIFRHISAFGRILQESELELHQFPCFLSRFLSLSLLSSLFFLPPSPPSFFFLPPCYSPMFPSFSSVGCELDWQVGGCGFKPTYLRTVPFPEYITTFGIGNSWNSLPILARGPHEAKVRAACGPRAASCPCMIWIICTVPRPI